MLAVHFGVFHPDNVVGQRRDLFGGQADAQRQVEFRLAGDGVVHQVFEQAFVAGLAIDEALAGTSHYRLLDQALFIKAIAQALGTLVGVVAQVGQQVIRTHELLEVGEYRIGFDQVFLGLGLSAVGR
ncbi:hypothetical protein [Pseudomonas sp. PMCC200344]|uniref:hypothetical protein n=1 Tax=Pseudomonas sp. PMCC200344 TaxID=3042028 RepID=UPI0024B36019|nr:hypothetical protein [Pseudomonas sp. PMCC200344]